MRYVPLVDTVDRMIGEAREHFAKEGFGIVAVEFGGADVAPWM